MQSASSSTSTLVDASLSPIDAADVVKSIPESPGHADLAAVLSSCTEEVPRAASPDLDGPLHKPLDKIDGTVDNELLLRTVLAVSTLNARVDILKGDINARFEAFDHDFTSRFDDFREQVFSRLREVEKAPVAQYAATRKELQDVRKLVIGKALEIGKMKTETREERTTRMLEGCQQRVQVLAEVDKSASSRRLASSLTSPMSPVRGKVKAGEAHELRDIAMRSQAGIENVCDVSLTFLSPPRRQISLKAKSRFKALLSPRKHSTPKGKSQSSVMASPCKVPPSPLPRGSMAQKENILREQPQNRSMRQNRPTSSLPRPSGSSRYSGGKSFSKLTSKLRMPGTSLVNMAKGASKNHSNGPSYTDGVLEEVSFVVDAPQDDVADDSLCLLDNALREFEDEVMLTSTALPRSSQRAGPLSLQRTRHQGSRDEESFHLPEEFAKKTVNQTLTTMPLPLRGNDSSSYLSIQKRATNAASMLTSLTPHFPSLLVTSPTFEF
ncbi:hypothetical protein CONPUDRAFT_169121 [Coniophora puteana RWD-64-598 SS2]|uniref:Uncharacterized protein n=1 Tax=Coniophora puteana (strain RWD-64-598) TaxID=741705 RepID=A0A5M3MB45_CONPW|nr:uncharacterized protein CONPUDRAFT_169121 [Coniophora puteana RWD-64-598 SS2]EIW75871.1 hypothetical protein CONPUDRAFT_169121 [Coniophora puteana RWD-64-598 SS2]